MNCAPPPKNHVSPQGDTTAKFSQRYGYTPVTQVFQRESINDALRTSLWNILKVSIWDKFDQERLQHDRTTQRIDVFVKHLWIHYFNKDLDQLPTFYKLWSRAGGAYGFMKEHFFTGVWFEVYDFIEAILQDQSQLINESTKGSINKILEKHNAAYRVVGDTVSEITDQNEIVAIEEALEQSDEPIRIHLETALRMLSDKIEPDYRNSVKESISAVEAACKLITGDPSATLGEALKRIENLHPAMLKAFSNLYGYTSDESGIRHALTNKSQITYSDAKFMLVACSAFVSYLKLSALKQE